MLLGIVEFDRASELRSACGDVAGGQQGNAHDPMSNDEWTSGLFRLGEFQEFPRELAHCVAIERHIVCHPESVQHRQQQQGILERLAERSCLFNQQLCPFHGSLGFRRGIAFDMEEWGYERDLKLDLIATQRRRARQAGNLGEGTSQLLHGFDQG
jgi:hypothetical protein